MSNIYREQELNRKLLVLRVEIAETELKLNRLRADLEEIKRESEKLSEIENGCGTEQNSRPDDG